MTEPWHHKINVSKGQSCPVNAYLLSFAIAPGKSKTPLDHSMSARSCPGFLKSGNRSDRYLEISEVKVILRTLPFAGRVLKLAVLGVTNFMVQRENAAKTRGI
jgi:hypothetical protein